MSTKTQIPFLDRDAIRHEPAREGDRKAIRLALLVAAIAVISWAATAFGQSTPTIVRVEEDWVIEISAPDIDASAPQIITALSSTERLADVHSVFEINHSNFPSYTPGGLQMQVWSGDSLLVYKNSAKTGTLNTANETITYTTSMTISGPKIIFEVKNGNSTTWGTFGTTGRLRAELDTHQLGFSRYSPETSVANSYVGYASHRVKKLALKQVRYYSALGLVRTDTTERIVHQHTAEVY